MYLANAPLSDFPLLSGISLIETGYAPRGIALLLGILDTNIYAFGEKVGQFPSFGKEIVGMIDFNKGEMALNERAILQEIRAD